MIDYLPSPKGLNALFLSVMMMLWISLAHAETIVSDRARQPFSHDTVIALARQLAKEPFKESEKAPESLTKLDYSTYRAINFQQSESIWGDSPTRFSIQLFAPGFLFKDLVNIDVVENGWAYPVKVTESSFKTPDPSLGKILAQVGKYAGMRLHYPINREDYKDEFIVFQGASYFRAVSEGQLYGLSTRGLAIDVAQPKGEEYPLFKHFWIERPSLYQKSIVVHALLDSKNVAGAYRLDIHPGSPTWIDIDVILFPRTDIQCVGLAPLTSMFMHSPMDAPDKADYRSAVHDSEALAMAKGNGEQIWRPLNNPHKLQVSSFVDENPLGFGLIQSHRRLDHYQDLEAKYHRRPSAWVEPLGNWGKGRVELVEIPSDSEANDNIVVFWRPEEGLKQGRRFSCSYRLSWPDDAPVRGDQVRIVRNAIGQKLFGDHEEIVVDYSHLSAEEIKNIRIEATISKGRILESRIEPYPDINGARVFVHFDPEDADLSELRVQLKKEDQPVAPTWLYRWNKTDWPS